MHAIDNCCFSNLFNIERSGRKGVVAPDMPLTRNAEIRFLPRSPPSSAPGSIPSCSLLGLDSNNEIRRR